MARKIRIEYAGAVYHVMARGNQGRDIYADDQDRKLWLEALAEGCEKTGRRIHAWVMMGNHYHLLLETPEANLVAGMKWLQGTYTQRYNSRRKLFGHLYPCHRGTPEVMKLTRHRAGAAAEGVAGKTVISLVVVPAHHGPGGGG
jgi:REP element-mobilizing transposase RayT